MYCVFHVSHVSSIVHTTGTGRYISEAVHIVYTLLLVCIPVHDYIPRVPHNEKSIMLYYSFTDPLIKLPPETEFFLRNNL